MPYHSYFKECEDLLIKFEENQSRMLGLDLQIAGKNFSALVKQMRQLFEQMSKELKNIAFKNSRDQLLISKQIELLLLFLQEMDLHMGSFFSMVPPDENKIIFIFERQHLFKNIYRKHIRDLNAIYEKNNPTC